MTRADRPPSAHGDGAFDRVLGPWHVTAAGVAVIIGAGIFVLLGEATRKAGGLVWLGFVVAAVLSALTALSYMELASMYPRAGSEHEFTRHAFPAPVPFLTGWAMTTALVVASATVALGFARYLGEFVDVEPRVAAPVLVLALTAVSAAGMERAAWVVVSLGAIEAATLLVAIAAGLPDLGAHSLFEGPSAVAASGGAMGGVLAAAALAFFAFIGFDEVITLAEETHDAHRTVPRALMAALAISTLLYVGVAVAGVSVLGADGLAASQRPLADLMSAALGGDWGRAAAAAALLSTASTVLLVVTAASRMLYGMASTGDLPDVLARVQARRVPGPALATTAVVASVLAAVGELAWLAAATDALVYATFVATNLSVIVLRFREPATPRHFRVPGAVRGVPVVPVAAVVVVLVVAVRLERGALIGAAGVLAAGAVVWALSARRPRRPGTAHG
ncbi:MAG: APC family permease [Ilumatobacteraceae bacterium]